MFLRRAVCLLCSVFALVLSPRASDAAARATAAEREAVAGGVGHDLRGGGGGLKGTQTQTITGLARLVEDEDLLWNLTQGKPTTILCHAASVLPDLSHAVDVLYQKTSSKLNLVSVLAPEHGFRGDKQAGHGDSGNSTVDPRTGLRRLGGCVPRPPSPVPPAAPPRFAGDGCAYRAKLGTARC